jgi:translocation and assembly module TamB
MQAQKIFFRITKFLGKAILWLLLVLIALVAVIHLPIVQKQVTHRLSDYLSSRIGSRVHIEGIDFSIRANLVLKNLEVWDREQTSIFSIQKAEISSSIFGLLKGDYIIDDIRISGVEGKLIQGREGLNIQFILDAFISDQDQATKSSAVKIQFKRIELEDVVFKYTSIPDGITLAGNLGRFMITEAEFSTNPTKIKAGKISLQHTVVNTVSTGYPNVENATFIAHDNQTIRPDFGTGIVFEVNDLEFDDNDFSFHRGSVIDTRKFDASHIALSDIQIRLSDFLMNEDTLAVGLKSLSVQLPGFTLDDARADIKLNRDQLSLSGIRVVSDSNMVTANLKAWYESNLLKDVDHLNVEFDASGKINPEVASYFFSDSVMNYFRSWKTTELALEGDYSAGKGEIKTLALTTKNSFLQADGMVFDVFNLEKLYWKDLVVNASIGSDFKNILTPFLPKINLPPDLRMQLMSSGNLKNTYLDGNIFTTWGDLKAIGKLTKQTNQVGIDMNLTGRQVDLRQWMNISWLGPIQLEASAKGIIGDEQNIEINGSITEVSILDQSVHDITFKSTTRQNDATINVSIEDLEYCSKISSEISFVGPLSFANTVQLNEFRLGRLLRMDSTLIISGSTKSKIIIDQSSLEGYVEGNNIFLQNQSRKHSIDTLNFHALVSPTASQIKFFTEKAKANLVSNFDINQSSNLIQTWSENIRKGYQNNFVPSGTRTLKFDLEIENASLIHLLGIKMDEFSSFRVEGEMDEQKQSIALQATSGKLKGYGISLDTLNTNLATFQRSVNGSTNVKNLFYNAHQLGNLDFDVLSKGDTAITNLRLSNDSIAVFGLSARVLSDDSGAFVYPDKFLLFDRGYSLDSGNPVHLSNSNVVFNRFKITRDSMSIDLDGDLSAFDVSFKNIDVTLLNFLLSEDSAVINNGHLNGDVSYSANQQINLKANIDNLSIYHSSPLTITATAKSDGGQIPFEFLLTNESNRIDMKGQYSSNNTEVDATLFLDVNNLELFGFLVSDFVDEMKGSLKGDVRIGGPIRTPEFKGYLQFLDAKLTTLNPKLTFKLKNDRITLDRSSLVFNNFSLYDEEDQPLTVNGSLSTKDYESFSYDLRLNTDNYTLLNKPDSTSGRFSGKLVIGSDIKLQGNSKDTKVEAKLKIRNATNLTFISSRDEIGLLKAEGVIDFVDPLLLLDSAALENSASYYDSLIASLPDFNLNSTIDVEDDALLRIVIDAQSGDYIEVSGGSSLDLGYDRTGNLRLSGNYTIKNGVYRLSFYDLVKKNFTLVQGSSINWNGSPENGDLNIKAVHTVQSNSLGLIGHEIGENEKSIYKRSLDYEVGININGTIENPIISFSLDLPNEEKTSYPVLANKLDRLRQPEYESELNKQVFGLLVLGGFLPETSGSDINSSLIATTALSNSVNSLLASQLNRVASQYIKGVNIDVGIQSFSDYSAPGGKTQTAMDFRVSKSVMDDRLSFEIGGDFDINQDQSGANTGSKSYRGDIAIIYDLTGNGDKQLKLFNNETYDIIYQEIRNTGISVIFIREFAGKEKKENKAK